MPPRKKAKAADETTPADVAEALKPVEMTSAELRHALEGKGIKAKAATARPALVKMLQEALDAGPGASAAPVARSAAGARLGSEMPTWPASHTTASVETGMAVKRTTAVKRPSVPLVLATASTTGSAAGIIHCAPMSARVSPIFSIVSISTATAARPSDLHVESWTRRAYRSFRQTSGLALLLDHPLICMKRPSFLGCTHSSRY